ncbi:hypothetical protein [Streptococcus dysgalactiae]|nr:hypothetical protein [Streptococcus dysgalactiae]SQF66266.1 internalin A-like histidine triad lipoprotein [Streptococcus dysgalactiae subsp. equisimilis]VEF04424.1 internalin A-like histidine triad lipoprotein [Streptococcus dysgalactiae subsp. equisimilis]
MKPRKRLLCLMGLVLTCQLSLAACQSQVKTDKAAEPKKHHTHKKSKKTSAVRSKKNDKKTGVAGIDKPTDDGFLLTDESQIESKTATGIIVKHDGHSHFFF